VDAPPNLWIVPSASVAAFVPLPLSVELPVFSVTLYELSTVAVTVSVAVSAAAGTAMASTQMHVRREIRLIKKPPLFSFRKLPKRCERYAEEEKSQEEKDK
jgi:hypothetical protein